MSCEGAALPFQAHANYGHWSIDFLEQKGKAGKLFFKNCVPLGRAENCIISKALILNLTVDRKT